ncbi:tetratricopeptide repeat protein [Epibacterium ulvae]|uniref:tetratricopeptide repeat protein n=1 Tax=Epibacterium ulvae TaxID=1156985 RepID=UPI001BFCBF41|nr:tetratricopeptide repeat protein [Epibacterium ulvae]MBT8152917.1 tetratricopeptide repeat protein [Epibacterium ulvae]
MRCLFFIPAVLLPTMTWALCPASPDHTVALEDLIEAVQSAKSETEAQMLTYEMWQYWADAPDEQSQEILDRGMERRAAYDFLGALQDFDRLIAYCPDYAEGYNQRAFVYFLQQDYASALVDLEKVLEISPRHVAALSGRALSLVALQRRDDARTALKQALKLNPWLPERGLLSPGGPLAADGVDL